MEKLLKIYTYVDGVNDTPFPNADAQIEIFSFNYDAKRMGGAPTISASVMYKDCLDEFWTGKEYVIYNGERYKLKQTPTSSKNNTDARYKHDLELVALRVVLDYVYFFDAVVENTPVDDKPVTNSTKVVFSGDIHEFAKRLNASLKYTKLDYSVVVDEGITSETKFLEFTDQPISSVLQEIYKQYEIPYYFEGNVIHIGFTSNAITKTFKYGANDALLSISKNNANNKIVNRCTGVGSSENIPYYYPNEHPLGEVNALYNNKSNNALQITNPEAYGKNVKLATKLTYTKTEKSEFLPINQWYAYSNFAAGEHERHHSDVLFCEWWETPEEIKIFNYWSEEYRASLRAAYGDYKSYNSLTEPELINGKYPSIAVRVYLSKDEYGENTTIRLPYEVTAIIGQNDEAKEYEAKWDVKYYYRRPVLLGGTQQIDGANGFKLSSFHFASDEYVYAVFTLTNPPSKNESIGVKINVKVNISPAKVSYDWHNENDAIKQLSFYGLSYNSTPNVDDTITFEQVKGSLIPYRDALMPPIYWQTKGAESFYNALNNTYRSPETGEYYSFENEYSDENRREHKETFDYIKPSIEFVKNGDNKPINMFLEFAYDENDNDEIDEQGNYLHPYFFAKLRKTNGDNPFNLFESANEKGEMTISMTSGNCGACQFVVGVEENTKKNIVQVDDNGILIYENGKVKFGAAQDRQNDTINNEVWIALKKDIQTFDTLLPNASIRPKACTNADTNDGDTFVITNISLPTSYIREAEERLKEEIIKYMKLNNSEKFTFSIKFSRIYLAENPIILAQLNENARIQIEYNEVLYELYVSSYQYKVVNNEVLPEITVELADTLSTNENALQQALNAVEHSIMSSVGSIDFYKQGLRYFIRKDVEDWARGLLHLTKGATFGTNDIAKIDEQGNAEFVSQIIRQFISTPLFIDGFAGQGFKLWLDENGKSNLTVDNLTARETFRVFEMLVTKLRAVNGGLFVSAANGTIKSVSESEDGLYYDILLENENTFIAGDYMRCQVMSGVDITSYWVEISEVNGGICRVPKTEFGFSLPAAGQDVVLCGSKNIGRQNAIHISATDDGQPRIDILNGISTKSLDGCLRTRLGNLDGIYDEYFGNNQPNGDGLYSDNAYLKGDFILRNSGESVETKFQITEEGIKSSVEQTQNESIKSGTFLYNASFTKGLEGWVASGNSLIPLFNRGRLMFLGNSMLAQSVTLSSSPVYRDIFYISITDGWIKQTNDKFVNLPDFQEEYEYPVSFTVNIRCKKSGTLTVEISDTQIYQGEISPSDTFVSLDVKQATWNGRGDFYLSFTGEADFYGLRLYTEDTEVRHKTLFEQTDKLITLAAKNFNEDGTIKNESGILIKPEGVGIVTKDENGNTSSIGTYEDGVVKLSGNEIRLEGNVTANDKVQISSEGELIAENATIKKSKLDKVIINGSITNSFQTGKYKLSKDDEDSATMDGLQDNNNVVITGFVNASFQVFSMPTDKDYSGFRAVIMNTDWGSKKAITTIWSRLSGGYYFYENGQQKNTLTVEVDTGVELLGLGDSDSFKGWIVLQRIYYRNQHNGFPFYVMFSGYVDENGTLYCKKTYNNETLIVTKIQPGNYKIAFEKPFLSKTDYMVFLTAVNNNNWGLYANVCEYGEDSFTVFTGFDGNPYNCGFNFMVINTSDNYID